jgi:hypothetical protein
MKRLLFLTSFAFDSGEALALQGKAGVRCCCCSIVDGTAQPMELAGAGATVKIDKTKIVYDLGKIAHGNPVVR